MLHQPQIIQVRGNWKPIHRSIPRHFMYPIMSILALVIDRKEEIQLGGVENQS